ncbi:MarR family winged helix-turn-helix transcriptional regulator [Neorhizobium galegae]|uniref:MarR family winged helix-turn-helix transcriptional regulator n=1 Tax=Neorhizobium galegae TaxID=399 RepID=UPI002100F16A|nr:MarR family winged helix-turn-helix transcriptional regulator [Neorhizobium galegae]MCQ1574628.1 MarR family winged helix-turn-helix transcriptional regulator [Neorhizobium galegae]
METPTDPTAIEHRILEGIARLATALRAEDWERSRAAGVNPTQYAILQHLEGRREGAGVKEIAAQLGVSPPTATDSIQALERKALVEKAEDQRDRRATRVRLTTAGRTALETGDALTGALRNTTEGLPAAEKQGLLVTLVSMIRSLQEQGAIPVQRMCVSCRFFRPYAHPDASRPHHCDFVNAAFGQSELRIDCRDHAIADPASRAATWKVFERG